ncbi:hypothetical protein GGR56DRAFT_55656 [Xylariaceae sp. FL0804]|nr:hypothetical protein GGR56DRAFT_55656 [Xylariaceae sp. FL0804]
MTHLRRRHAIVFMMISHLASTWRLGINFIQWAAGVLSGQLPALLKQSGLCGDEEDYYLHGNALRRCRRRVTSPGSGSRSCNRSRSRSRPGDGTGRKYRRRAVRRRRGGGSRRHDSSECDGGGGMPRRRGQVDRPRRRRRRRRPLTAVSHGGRDVTAAGRWR